MKPSGSVGGRQVLQNADLLQTIAEVAVAFVGFASLAGIVGSRQSAPTSEVQAGRLRGMVQSGLVVIAFCFVPFIFDRFGVPEQLVWRFSSAGLAVAGIGLAWSAVRLSRRVREAELATIKSRRRMLAFGIAVAEVLLGATVVGVLHDRAAAAYLAGLLVFLFLAGFLFAGVISSFFVRQKG